MRFPTVAEWAAHPDAFDRLTATLERAGARYDGLDDDGRRRMAHDERTYRLLDLEIDTGKPKKPEVTFGFSGGSRCESIDATTGRDPLTDEDPA